MRDYVGNLNIQFDPFDKTVESSGFFASGNRQSLLHKLIQLSSYSLKIAVVTGPLGCGKSFLAQRLVNSLGADFVVVYVPATLFMNQLQLLEVICNNLDIAHQQQATAAELGAAIKDFSIALADEARVLQLVVDDAQELGNDALQAVLDLVSEQADYGPAINAVFFGEAQLLKVLDYLDQASIQETSIVKMELEPLSSEEAIEYVMFKLSLAGYTGRLPIDAGRMGNIYNRSKGIPGTLNALVRDELDQFNGVDPVTTAASFPKTHLKAACLLIAVLLLSLLLYNGETDETVPVSNLAINSVSTVNRIQLPLGIPAAARQPLQERNFAVDTAAAIAGTARVTAPINQSRPNDNDNGNNSAALPATSAMKSVPAVVTDGPEVENEANGNNNLLTQPEQRLLSLQPDSFTLQLLGSHSEANVQKFIANNGGGDRYAYYETSFQARPWFVVVYGNYPDRVAATAAITGLPRPLRELEPWARNLSGIQQDIRK